MQCPHSAVAVGEKGSWEVVAMDESPPRRHNASDKHHRGGVGSFFNMFEKSSARRLFVNKQQQESAERLPRKDARRRLILVPEDEISENSSNGQEELDDDERGTGRREPGVVAKLMGLEAFPESTASSKPDPAPAADPVGGKMVHQKRGEVQLQELLRIREPLLLHELLRESEDPTAGDGAQKKPSLREKFAGFVKRRPLELNLSLEPLKKPFLRSVASHSELVESIRNGDGDRPKMTKQKDRLVVVSPRSPSLNRSSPIKSPCKSKRGLMLEAAVKILEPSSQPSKPLRSPTSTTTTRLAENVNCKQESVAFPQQQQHTRRRFSLSRSSSESTLQLGKKSEGRGGLARLSENVGRELSRRFGVGGGSKASCSLNAEKQSSKAGARKSGLVRSKSDLGLQGAAKLSSSKTWADSGSSKQNQVGDELKKHVAGKQQEDHLSSSGTSLRSHSGSGILSYSSRLFGNRGKENNKPSDGVANTTKKGEPSSLVRALLRRRNPQEGSSRAAASGKEGSQIKELKDLTSSHGAAVQTEEQERNVIKSRGILGSPEKALPDQSRRSSAGASHCEAAQTDDHGSVSKRPQFSDHFLVDTIDHDRTRSPPHNCDSRSRSESGQPSPVSVLEAPFVDEIHTPPESSSGEDSPDAKSRLLREYRPGAAASDASTNIQNDNIINAILDISRIRCIDLSSIGINETSTPCSRDEEEAYVEEILSTSQLLCEKAGSSWYSEDLPINPEVFSIVESKMGNSTGPLQARKLIFHCVDEAVDVKLSSFRKAGAPPWIVRQPALRPRLLGKQLVSAIYGQISEWSSMSTSTTDELVQRDMDVGVGKWRDSSQEVEELGRDIERSIFKKMIEELVWDVFVLHGGTGSML